METASPPPAARRNIGTPLVAASVAAFLIAGAIAYHYTMAQTESPLQTSGFDAQEVAHAPPPVASAPSPSLSYGGAAPAAMQPIATGLGSVRIGGSQVSAPGRSAQRQKGGFDHDLIVRETARLAKNWDQAVRRSRVLQTFTREWNSHPDLAALNEGWHRDHDPKAFVQGLMSSKAFGQLLFKYARQPDVTAIAMKQIRSASPEAMEQATDALDADKTAKAFVMKVGDAAGIPLGAMLGGQAPDAATLLKNSPALQQAGQQ